MMRFVSLALLIAATGCSSLSPFVYRPEAQANATIDNRPAARYELPPESPRGDVRLAALGATEIQVRHGRSTRVMHFRMILANTSDDQTWALDTRDVRAQFGDLDQACPPDFVALDPGTNTDMPYVRVPRGERRTLDLYFELPARMRSEKRIPKVDVIWEVRTGTRVVAERTPFARQLIPPSSGDLGFEGGYTPPY